MTSMLEVVILISTLTITSACEVVKPVNKKKKRKFIYYHLPYACCSHAASCQRTLASMFHCVTHSTLGPTEKSSYSKTTNTIVLKRNNRESQTIFLKELHHRVCIKKQPPAFTVWYIWFQVILEDSAGGIQL